MNHGLAIKTALIANVFVGSCALAQSAALPELILNQGTPDELVIAIDESAPVRIDPATGDIAVSTVDPQACSGQEPGTCPEATVVVAELAPDPGTVEQGSSFTASLGSLGALACRRSGLPGTTWDTAFVSPPQNGTRIQTVGVDVPPGFYTLEYECSNGDFTGSATSTLEVVVGNSTEPPVPASCDDVPLPSGWARDTTAIAKSNATTRTWSDAFRGAIFPNTQGENIAVNENRFAAFSFDPSTADVGATGQIGFGDLFGSVGQNIGSVAPTISISECPGDFRPELGNCRLVAGSPFRWTTISGDTSSRCSLPNAETLYLNITYIAEFSLDDPSGFIWTCGGESECGHFVQ